MKGMGDMEDIAWALAHADSGRVYSALHEVSARRAVSVRLAEGGWVRLRVEPSPISIAGHEGEPVGELSDYPRPRRRVWRIWRQGSDGPFEETHDVAVAAQWLREVL